VVSVARVGVSMPWAVVWVPLSGLLKAAELASQKAYPKAAELASQKAYPRPRQTACPRVFQRVQTFVPSEQKLLAYLKARLLGLLG
jgi:hypothetical protein